MNKIRFEANKLITSSFEVEFEYNIDKIEYIDRIILVLLEIPKGSKEVDNLYGVDEIGNILWRVQSIKEAFGIPQNTPYVALKVVNADTVQVTSFYGMRFSVDISNGKLIDKESIKW
jgi:hypothetical protein